MDYSSDSNDESIEDDDSILYENNESFDKPFIEKQELRNNLLLKDIIDSLYDNKNNCDFDINKIKYFFNIIKFRQIPRNAGTHNRPQCSYSIAASNEWTNNFLHLRVIGSNFKNLKSTDIDEMRNIPSPLSLQKKINYSSVLFLFL